MMAVAAILLVLLVAGLWHVSKHLRRHDVVVAKRDYPIQGIDVSNHNGVIDFSRVAADSIAFVYVKASEGVSYRDPRFDVNIVSARKAGLKVGAYHFFRKDKDGALQAENFMAATDGAAVDMPYVIDVEDWGNSMLISDTETVNNLRTMIGRLEQKGLRLMVYTNKDGYRKYMRRFFPRIRLWLCAFSHPKDLEGYDWTLHQYSHWGNVAGIDGDVDLNVFNGDSVLWNVWLAR